MPRKKNPLATTPTNGTKTTLKDVRTFEDATWSVFQDAADLMFRKQHDYGHGNILDFGEYGVLVRLNDKVARLKNLTKNGKTPNNESLNDSWMDILNYACIALMLRQGTFTLPLENDIEE